MCTYRTLTRNENGERRLLIWQLASGLLIIFANISMTWDVKKKRRRILLSGVPIQQNARRQTKSDAPDQ
jgi:hypothetical protein